MLLIPAIDIKEGTCVRLRQGEMGRAVVFSDSPVDMAAKWVDEGARRLHLVDLDGAFAGKPKNRDIVHQITQNHPAVPVQIGGGIRNQETVSAYLEAGVQYVIIGTWALQQPDAVKELAQSFPDNIMVGIDAKEGKVAVEGWANVSNIEAIDLAQRFAGDGVQAIIYTDITRDGMMQGVNIEATKAVAQAVEIPIIASGGVSCIADLQALQEIQHDGVTGAITGRAIYEGALDFASGQALLDETIG